MEIHLASMENVTCWAFRKLMLGATDSYTGVMSAEYLIKRSKAWKEIDTFNIEKQKQWIQIATCKEKECSEFISRLNREIAASPEKDNVYGLQLNISSPSSSLINLGQGPALIKRPKKVASLVQELLKQDKYKVSIKTRLGLNAQELAENKIFFLLEELEKIHDPNFSEIVVHFRHAREESFKPYDYSLLDKILEFKIPIVVNGGINNYKDILKIKDKRKIAGIMIGREALRNPDCFVDISNNLNHTSLRERTIPEIKSEFEKLCQENPPKDIYLNTIKRMCDWDR
ncbi:MAG: tRNA-dihydrouridine synthase family protein [archaeon]|nr:tRNA-dihydrouridine synthase family protein [archaeon]